MFMSCLRSFFAAGLISVDRHVEPSWKVPTFHIVYVIICQCVVMFMESKLCIDIFLMLKDLRTRIHEQ